MQIVVTSLSLLNFFSLLTCITLYKRGLALHIVCHICILGCKKASNAMFFRSEVFCIFNY